MFELLNFNIMGDHNGNLIALEKNKGLPFDIKRVFYIWGTAKDVVRGKHAHFHVEQVLVCVSGSCDFILDDGTKREIVHMNDPSKGLYIKSNIWREFTNFSSDCIVMVLASAIYDEKDYIRDYQQFLQEMRK